MRERKDKSHFLSLFYLHSRIDYDRIFMRSHKKIGGISIQNRYILQENDIEI